MILSLLATVFIGGKAQTLRECSLESRPAAPSEIVSEASGLTYLSLSDDGTTIARYDYKTGKQTAVVMSVDKLRGCDVESWSGFILSPNEKLLLLYTNVQPIYRHSYKADFYVYDIARNNIKKLSDGGPQEVPAFSPDSRMVAFVRDNNIYVVKLDYGTEVVVTKDGKKNEVINGVPDWAYQEELDMLSSLTWSPDSKMLAFLKWNEKDVNMYNMPVYASGTDESACYTSMFSYKYPVAGAKNSDIEAVSYDVETRALKVMNVPLDHDGYINKIEFATAPERLMVSTLNRNQNELKLYVVNPRSAMAKLLYTDKSKSWIDPSVTSMTKYYDTFFIVASERDGWCHLYQYSNAGSLMKQLTKGEYEVTDFYGYDKVAGKFYYQTTQSGPLNRVVTALDKKDAATILSPKEGTASAQFNATFTHFVLNYSNVSTPNTYTIYTAAGKEIRTLESNSAYAAKFAGKPQRRFFTFNNAGETLNGYMILPSGFTESKRYPVIMYQYCGPKSQLVRNRWEVDWLDYAAKQGYLVVCVDGRGTGARGAKFASKVYKNIGKYETEDQLAAANYVASLPYVDKNKIGIFGWSYGGYESLMAMTAPGNPYVAGIAVAPVTDWRLYDSIYTERFMLTPQQNAAGYDAASALSRINNLTGRLLIVAGTADDNVHIVNTYKFVEQATLQNKTVDMMIYPNKDHSIRGGETRYALYSKLLDYFNRNLK